MRTLGSTIINLYGTTYVTSGQNTRFLGIVMNFGNLEIMFESDGMMNTNYELHCIPRYTNIPEGCEFVCMMPQLTPDAIPHAVYVRRA